MLPAHKPAWLPLGALLVPHAVDVAPEGQVVAGLVVHVDVVPEGQHGPELGHLRALLPGPAPGHLEAELITNEQLELALIDQQGTGLRLGELLVQWGWVESSDISRALAEQYELEFVDLDSSEIERAAVERLAPAEARNRGAIPIRVLDDDRLLVGVADPTDVGACDELRALLGGKVTLVVVDQVELHRALAREYS